MTRHLAPAALLLVAMLGAGCGGGALRLHAPNIAPAEARQSTPVELEPIASGDRAVRGSFQPPGPASVLTAAMNAELRGRKLHGGEHGGYGVTCTLGRFAVRVHASVTEGQELLAVYADLSCEARRTKDAVLVWRGELRGRACGTEGNVFGSDSGTTQRLVDRALSDVAREMA